MPSFASLARSLGRQVKVPLPSWTGQGTNLGTSAKSASVNAQVAATSLLGLTYTAVTKPSWITVSPSGLITGTASWNDVGATTATSQSNTIQIRATDASGQYVDSPNLTLTVTSTVPVWSTSATLTPATKTIAFSQSLSALSDSTVSYTLNAGSSLPAGTALTTGGVLSGAITDATTSDTTYSFTVQATDLENQNIPRTFSLFASGVLYTFTTHTFTNASASGRTGPTLAQCRAAYSTTWDENSSFFNVVTQGIQVFTIPRYGEYEIEVGGGQGGGYSATSGGLGRRIKGRFVLTNGSTLHIVIGQRGKTNGTGGGGGGGASRVYINSLSTPLIIAGGGGGRGRNYSNGGDANFTTNGNSGLHGADYTSPQTFEYSPGWAGKAGGTNGSDGLGAASGSNGSGGNPNSGGGGGGGVGSNTSTFLGGSTREGGFGGGGGGGENGITQPDSNAGGGGGGYSGGGSGGNGGALGSGGAGAGGGGGSYIDASATSPTDLGLNGVRDYTTTERGYVKVTFVG